MVLLRVLVMHVPSGACLFDHLCINAPPVVAETGPASSICQMVLTFYKLSRDFGGEGVSRALFDLPRPVDSPRLSVLSPLEGQVSLICEKSEAIGVVLFHEATDDVDQMKNLRMLAPALIARFEEQYGVAVRSLKPKFDAFEDNPDILTVADMAQFNNFQTALNGVKEFHHVK
eukprot:m51a1_g13783 hypothetical protein (173) ;mRNA; r:313072-313727